MSSRLPWVAASVAVATVLILISRSSAPPAPQPGSATVAELMTEAKARFEQEGDASGALLLIDEAIALAPDQLALHQRKADVLLAARRPEEALTVLETARRLKPDEWPTYTLLMRAWTQLERCDIAIPEVEAYLARFPNHARAHYARGHCHYREGRWELALADVTRACELGHQPGCDMAESYGKPAKIRSVERTMVPQ